jgi:hypothetical protein
VTIYGSGFTPTDQVSFSQNYKQAASTVIQSATSNQIVFTLSNVLVANEPAGTYQLSVWDPQSKGGAGSNSVNFVIGSGASTATIDASALRSLPNTGFTITGGSSASSGSLTVVVVGPNYTGATDWNTVGNLLKGGGSAVSNSASISNGRWSASFYNGFPTEGFYTVLVYDGSYNLLTTGQLYNTLKG